MDVVWSVGSGIQLFGKSEERSRVTMEEIDIEDGFRKWDVILL